MLLTLKISDLISPMLESNDKLLSMLLLSPLFSSPKLNSSLSLHSMTISSRNVDSHMAKLIAGTLLILMDRAPLAKQQDRLIVCNKKISAAISFLLYSVIIFQEKLPKGKYCLYLCGRFEPK